MEYIILSIPLFFLLMGLELAWSAWSHRKVYRFSDFVANLGCGIGSQVVGAFTKASILTGTAHSPRPYSTTSRCALTRCPPLHSSTW